MEPLPLSTLVDAGSRRRAQIVAILSLLAPILGAVASAVPSPYSWICAVGSVLAAGAAGLASKVPTFLVGRPIFSGTLATSVGAIGAILLDQAMSAPTGTLERAVVLAVAVVCFGLAGKPLPAPGARVASSLAVLLLAGTLLQGCATSYRPRDTGPTAFSFQLSPEQCAQLKKERRGYRATERTSVYVAGAGALVSALALALSDEKSAPAISTGVSLAAGGVGAFTSSQVSDLDQELADGGCGR